MPQVIIGIQRDTMGSDALAARLYRAPTAYPNAMDPSPLNLPVPMPCCDTEPNLTAYGAAVFQALAGHQAISREIDRLSLALPPVTDGLQFRIETPLGERIRWETLCTNAKFLAVAPGCRITRLASSVADPEFGVRTFTPPLRFVAFLSALKLDAKPELQRIVDRITRARTDGLPIEAMIYLGEEPLLADMTDQPPAGFTFAPMPRTADELKVEIKRQQFQFLHLFCHGRARAGVSSLAFATINDNLTNADTASVNVAIDELVGALVVQKSAWLTVLNSCSGAQAFPQLNSMAFKIAERGCPVALGMNEPIEVVDAGQFTEVFYREVFEIVRQGLAVGAGTVALDLSPAIVPVRQKFHEVYATEPVDAFGRWTLPVFYENAAGLHVSRLSAAAAPVDAAMKARIDVIAGLLRRQPADTPLPKRLEFLAILDTPPTVPIELRPDPYGQFPGAEG